MSALGDFDLSAVIYDKFTTYQAATSAPTTLAGTPVLSVYKDNSTTQSTTGVTLTVDFDGVTGFNHYAIDTSTDATFYSAGSFFNVVITTGTVNSVSVVGSVVGEFTIRKTSALKPTTAGQSLNISSGVASANALQIGSSTTSVTNLNNGLLGTAGPVPWADITDQGTAQAVASGSITLRAGFTTDNNNIVGSVIWITGGTTGLWQNRTILTYTDSTKVATVDTWTTTPTGTTTYTLLAAAPGPATPISVSVVSGGITRASYSADSGDQTIRSNTLTAGAAGTATLDAGASAVTDFYVNCLLYLTGGTGVGQARFITAYNGSTKVATTSVNWKTTPDNTSTFAIIPFDAIVGATAPTAAQNATAVWQDPLSGSDFTTVGSIGKLLHDDIDAAVSTRATPAQVTSAVPTVMQTADALLNRDWSAVSDTNTHTVLQALRFLRNVWAISGTNLTVKKEDGTTTAWTGTVTPAPGAAPISGNTPS